MNEHCVLYESFLFLLFQIESFPDLSKLSMNEMNTSMDEDDPGERIETATHEDISNKRDACTETCVSIRQLNFSYILQ